MAEDQVEPQAAPQAAPSVDPGVDPGVNPRREQVIREELERRDAEADQSGRRGRRGRKDRAAKGGDDDPLRGSRTSGFYVGVALLGIVLILLIIFIAQNTRKTTVSFLGWDGSVPVAVALLIAAAAGLFLALLASGLRILQLRRRVKRIR